MDEIDAIASRPVNSDAEELGALCLRAAEEDPDRPTAAAVDAILVRAAAWQASDVHVSPGADAFTVRFRLDGVLARVASIPRDRLPLIVQRLKVLAKLLTYRTDVPQDGRVDRDVSPVAAELRVAVLPTIHGEKAVVRFLRSGSGPVRLGELGWPTDGLEALRDSLVSPQGLVAFSGPSGSGKTTTIYAALRELTQSGQRSVVSVEDPVEVDLPGVDQTAVDSVAGLGFGAALRALLRHDPEVIFVGEVRDPVAAATSVEAGLTGHLVLTTVHAGSCCEALVRFLDLGVEPYALASTLRRVFGQRLVRRTCTECGGAGGACCRQTGYRGRVPLVEHLSVEGVRAEMLAGATVDRLQEVACAAGLVSLAERAGAAVESGWTTPEEVRRCLGA
jgi:general secretion pathway protein E